MSKLSAYFSIILISIGLYSCSSDQSMGANPKPSPDTTDIKAKSPTVKIMKVSKVTKRGATIEGKVIQNGSSNVRERGVCWDTSGVPTIEDSHKKASSFTTGGNFTVDLGSLEENTQYYMRAYAINKAGAGYSDTMSVATKRMKSKSIKPKVVYVDSTSFSDTTSFMKHWGLFYPWGRTHNGSARMFKSHIILKPDSVLLLKANRIKKSTISHDPPIHYHSGTIYLKKKITISSALPRWVISVDLQVPTDKGTWPAFWLTGANNWPPEIDIVEYKGSNTWWQNTATGPSWRNVHWQTKTMKVQNAGQWHHYAVKINKLNSTDVSIRFYLDGKQTASQTGNFMGKPFWLIIDLQTEGSSGSPGPGLNHEIKYKVRNVYIAAFGNN